MRYASEKEAYEVIIKLASGDITFKSSKSIQPIPQELYIRALSALSVDS